MITLISIVETAAFFSSNHSWYHWSKVNVHLLYSPESFILVQIIGNWPFINNIIECFVKLMGMSVIIENCYDKWFRNLCSHCLTGLKLEQTFNPNIEVQSTWFNRNYVLWLSWTWNCFRKGNGFFDGSFYFYNETVKC